MTPPGRDGREADELTAGQYLTNWLADVSAGGSIRPTTAKAYEVAIRVHIVPTVGRVPLRLLTRGVVQEMYLSLRSHAVGRRGPLSPKAIHNVHLTLHRALQDAVADRLIQSNPAARAHRIGHPATATRCWSADELRRFLGRVASAPDAAFWRLAACTGMRRGELLGLQWEDVDLELRTICIQRQLIRIHGLRHTHATLALQAAINPKVVQERLGHASVKVTLDTYTHVLPPMHREAAARIAALIDVPRGSDRDHP